MYCHALVCYSYVLACTRMLLVCTRMHSYVTCMYSYVFAWCSVWTRMVFACTRMLLVCYSCVLACTRMLLVCTRMYTYFTRLYSHALVCYSYVFACTRMYVLVWCFSHDLAIKKRPKRFRLFETKNHDLVTCKRVVVLVISIRVLRAFLRSMELDTAEYSFASTKPSN